MENEAPCPETSPMNQVPDTPVPAPAVPQQSTPSAETTIPESPPPVEASATVTASSPEEIDSAADTASDAASTEAPTQEDPGTAFVNNGAQASLDPDSDPRYKNKYAKQHRSDLDRLPDGAEKNYLLDRVFPQMAYYSKASAAYKKTYHRLTVLCIIFNGVIPFIMLFEAFKCVAPYVKFAVTALSSAAGILTAIVALKRHRELWIQYRTCLEQLKRAVSMYFLGVGDFDYGQKPEERTRTLFAVCENILSAEHNQWTELNKEKKDD